MCVGFWYTCLASLPSDFRVKRTSMKCNDPSYSFSMVNLMRRCCLFKCCRSSSPPDLGTMEITSSTNLLHNRGFVEQLAKAFSSKFSIKMSAITAKLESPSPHHPFVGSGCPGKGRKCSLDKTATTEQQRPMSYVQATSHPPIAFLPIF